MKKFVFNSLVFLLGNMALDASAQYAVRGTFSSCDNGNGTSTLFCDGSGFCGMLGRDVPGGGQLFKASDGSLWVVYSSTGNPKEELESGTPVIAKPVDEEEG